MRLFQTVPRNNAFGFMKNGELDIKQIVNTLDYKKAEVAIALNISPQSVRYDNRIPKELKERFIEWATAISMVYNYFKDKDKTILWFSAPNHELGGISPRDMIKVGRCKKLLKFISAATTSQE